MNRKSFVSFFFCFLLSSVAFAQEKVTTVLLVRHAEKSAAPANDPILNAQGTARAELLARMFQNSGITAIYTSEFARTRLTAEPLARKIGVAVKTVNANSSKQLVDTIRSQHSGGTVLVVGHSNTIPEIIAALGGAKMEEIPETEYDNLFVLTFSSAKNTKVLSLQFYPPATEQVCQ